jgi:large subunit ribosomal protein L21
LPQIRLTPYHERAEVRRILAIYAIIKTGGKQYRVEPGQRLRVERMDAEAGSRVELNDVLLLAGDGEVHSGDSVAAGARVVAEVAGHGRSDKILVFKYKPKVRYRRRKGHRQHFTELLVQEIIANGKSATAKAKERPAPRGSRTRQKAKLEESVAEVAAGALADVPEQEVSDEPPKPTGRQRSVKAVAEGALADTPEAELEQNAERAEPERKPRSTRSNKKK